MKRIWVFRKWVLLGLAGAAVAKGWADLPVQWRGGRGWEPESAYCRLYDAKTVVTVKGIVQRVESIIPMKGMGYGIHLVLKTDSETLPVHLGPTWYVEKQPVRIRAQDVVEVTGSRVPCDGKPIILAALIKRGAETVKFREANGRPAWAGGRR